jgi:hypothetical protein
MHRPTLAFLVAGLVAPIAFAASFYHKGALNELSYGVVIVVSAIISFCGVVFLAVPAYRFLRAKNWTAFWIAPLVGFIVATVAWYIFNLLFGLAFSRSLPNRWRIVAGGAHRSICRHPCMAHRQTGSFDGRRKYRKYR